RDTIWYLRNTANAGLHNTQFAYGTTTDAPLYSVQQPDASPGALRSRIVAIAKAEIGVSGDSNYCQKYGPLCDDWCAMFTRWVWREAGVTDLFNTYVARGVGRWGVEKGLFVPRPPGARGNPMPGDIVVYGAPANVVGGHVSIVESVHANGMITTINGNHNNKVVQTVINPITHTSGADNLHISGYVRPPGS
ncbi:CHAP domain-containing protein, partial [Nonomuraea sp. NPDC050663]|uniref:CHAP domain-containing protein n=1 Tax=Nonomuraea sp. NPDC050663 TaxID=3364370 RepID=UPI0037A5C69C